MWRVVKDMYRRVSSSVVLDDHVTSIFDTEEGLRQGSVLSPLLFSIFLADVIDEWRRLGIGVRIGGGEGGTRTIGGLLFADDIVLVAESAAELQQAMDVMSDHARRWRYKLDHSKCAVVVAGMRKPSDNVWLLSGEQAQEMSEYKYLGVQLQKTGRWTSWQEARTKAARGAMVALWWGGARGGHGGLPLRTGERLVREMLLPTLLYGCEVVGMTRTRGKAGDRAATCGMPTTRTATCALGSCDAW